MLWWYFSELFQFTGQGALPGCNTNLKKLCINFAAWTVFIFLDSSRLSQLLFGHVIGVQLHGEQLCSFLWIEKSSWWDSSFNCRSYMGRSHWVSEGCCQDCWFLPVQGPFPRRLVIVPCLETCISSSTQYCWESLKGPYTFLTFLPGIHGLNRMTVVADSPQTDIPNSSVH